MTSASLSTLQNQISDLLKQFQNDPELDIEKRRIKYLGKKGLFNEISKIIRDVESTDKKQAEKELEQELQDKTPKAALTELFLELKTEQTPAVIERIVTDIDAIVRVVRFPGWQTTSSGEREVQKSLRKQLLKYKLHKDQMLFERAYAYIKEYY